jgi:hypothetical protein
MAYADCRKIVRMAKASESVESTIKSLLNYCAREDWSGYDPYDALNSRFFNALPLSKSKAARIAITQALKRCPINLRRPLLVSKGENPKACALFTSALVRLSRSGILENDSAVLERVKRLMELRSDGYPYVCWGYNFDWQNRVSLLPKYTPNIICTTFGGNALLDAYEKFADRRFLEAATSAGEFIVNGLNVTEEGDGLCFSYTPLDRDQVHNANLLGAAFIGRLSQINGNSRFGLMAERAVRYTLSRQRPDGSWPYGEGKTQRWIDNFHTGYNLVALLKFSQMNRIKELPDFISKGFRFYILNFFTPDGSPKYFHDRVWPIDIHSVAQSIVTLCEFSDFHRDALPLAEKVFQCALLTMRSEKGYFYYQKMRFLKNKISYMRWSQAWMLYALAFLADRQRRRGMNS